MHIVHCLTHSTHGGGQAVPYVLIKNLLRFWPVLRHTVLLPSDGIYVARFRELGVHVIEFPFHALDPVNFFRIRSILRDLKPDVIHTHGRGAGVYVRAISKSVLPGRRIHTHHGFHIPEKNPGTLLFQMTEEVLLARTDHIVSVSESEADVIGRTNQKAKKKITVIPNIVDREAVVADAAEEIPEVQHHSDRLNSKFVITMIGRDDPIKNYPLAFAAAKKLLAGSPTALFLFIGINRETDMFEALQAQYPDNILPLPALANPLPLLKQSSVLLITSKREAGAPLVMMEAACLGVPVVGVRVRGLYDSIDHGENGLCVENDPDAISQSLRRCILDRELMDHMSRQALAYAQRFDVTLWCEKYYSLYLKPH